MRRVGALRVGIAFLLLTIFPSEGMAEGKELPFEAKSFLQKYARANAALNLPKPVLVNCLDGSAEQKTTVCTYKAGGFLITMVSMPYGQTKASEVTMICTPKEDTGDTLRCLLSYGALLSLTSPALDADQRGKVISSLIGGIGVGEDARVTVRSVRYILQKLDHLGVWFHAQATED